MRQDEENCLKYLKRGWNRIEGREHKDFKKGSKLGQGVDALKKRGGAGTPLNLSLYIYLSLSLSLSFFEMMHFDIFFSLISFYIFITECCNIVSYAD